MIVCLKQGPRRVNRPSIIFPISSSTHLELCAKDRLATLASARRIATLQGNALTLFFTAPFPIHEGCANAACRIGASRGNPPKAHKDTIRPHLDHKVLDGPVKLGPRVVAPLAQGQKVFARLGHQVAVELQV